METRELILLGILMAHSQHGYQINEFIENNLSTITDMKKATAYNFLDKLYSNGYVEIEIEQQGNRPPRKVYSINEKGRNHFLELLSLNLSKNESDYNSIDVGLMFSDYLSDEELIQCLETRLEMIEADLSRKANIPEHTHIKGVNLTIEHNFFLKKTESEWIMSVIDRLQAKKANDNLFEKVDS